LATDLGVTPMALYRHVANKDDLLEEVVNRLMADRWRPDVPEDPWQVWVAEAADRFRRFLVEEPVALQVYLRRPLTSPTALERMDAFLSALRRALGDDARARAAYATMQTYTLGFAAVEAARDAASASAQPEDAPETVRELAAYTSPEQFRRGLGYLLRGLTSG
jgi:AcrR family transcriptional regulator